MLHKYVDTLPPECQHISRFMYHKLTSPRYLDMSSLLSWLSARQHAPEGGLGGRTNKLVDGCYCHWIGGCWALVSAAIEGGQRELWNREGLLRYILCCCQNERGGLRDKPSK